METAYEISPHVAWQVIAEEAVLVDLLDGRTLGLNKTGSFIWQRLMNGLAEGDVARELVERYKLEASQAARDVSTFVALLADRKLIRTG